jgi:5-(aminomethyl)-3-furanmethanol phosphate kinase
MWVVKISGSLSSDPLLPQWLELLAQLGSGRVTVVCGGGGFVEAVRQARAHWHFDGLPARNMAVLAMAQAAYLAQGLESRLRLAVNEASLRKVLRAGHTALWLPTELLREGPSQDTTRELSSDNIALDLACRLNAEHLVLVKSGVSDPTTSEAQPGKTRLLEQGFESIASGAGVSMHVVGCADLARMRELLQGNTNPTGTD